MGEPSRTRRSLSRSMIARLESGEVLLTTSIAEVGIQVFEGVLARDIAFHQLHAKGEMAKFGHRSSLTERQPTIGVKAAREFDLHEPFALPRLQGQGRQNLLAKIQSDAQKFCIRSRTSSTATAEA
jgi:hypothetical protein